MSCALKVTRARGSPLLVAFPGLGHQVIRDDGDPVALADRRSRALREGPKAITLTQRVTLSAPGSGRDLEGASRSSTPVVPVWVVKVRGSSPRRPVMVMLIGFTVVLLVR